MGLKQILAKLAAVLTSRTKGYWMTETNEAIGYWVPGGSLVFVPAARLHEILQVLEEHRRQEYELNSVWFRR